jgi:hypothetical protein
MPGTNAQLAAALSGGMGVATGGKVLKPVNIVPAHY